MMRITAALLVAALTLSAAASTVDVESFEGKAVPNTYIVKLKSMDTPKLRFTQFLQRYQRENEVSGNVGELGTNNAIQRQYSHALNGFAGRFTQGFLNALKKQHSSEIEYIVPDGEVRALDTQQTPPSWGLTRTSQRALNLPGPYHYPTQAGAGVDVWVLDTGVQFTHKDFGGRASLNASFVQENGPDLNGHGTHCAGTIGSATYGVAKKVTIKGVKVLSGSGSGTWQGVIAGVDHVAKFTRPGKTIVSMSLGGGKNQALNDAMDNLVKKGAAAIVAAGNNGGDACQISPASASLVYSVMASDNTDKLASFSNRGKCTKIAAPGVNIMSLWKGAEGATNTISGTSMATPHVAGVAALLASMKHFANGQQIYAELTNIATKNVISNMPADGSPNLLLFNSVGRM